MAVAAPKRRSSAAPAPAPPRTAPPKRRKAAPGPSPIRRTKGKGAGTVRAAAAPATVPTRRAPARKTPARRAPTRAPQRARPKTKRSGGQPSLAIAVGRTAGAVRQLPDSGLVVRMTRGRAWIAVLGVLLVGIVGLNVVTLSFAASSGKIDEQISTLEAENSMLKGKVAKRYGPDRIRNEAAAQGLRMSTELGPRVLSYSPADVGIAAARLSGAG
jgi:hypothetical protein